MLTESLKKVFKDTGQVSTNETILEQHGKTLTYHTPQNPNVVVFPTSEEQLIEVIKVANEYKQPIVPYGVGTCLEGQTIPNYGGITVDFSTMNKIISIQPEDFTVVVQPGVTREQLNLALKKYGLFFPVDPGANATIGGMTATNASGTNAVKYGTMRQQVRKLRVVLANGKAMSVGSDVVKTSAGYSLKDLFIGSEGTLGFISEITLKVYGIEEYDAVVKATFESIEDASEAAMTILSAGIKVTKMELVDAKTIEIVNGYSNTTLQESPSLFIELSGSRAEVELQLSLIELLAQDWTNSHFYLETDSIKKAKLWEARHHAGLAIAAANPGKTLLSTDVCVPISKLRHAIQYARNVVDEQKMVASIFGHVGDGNFHVVLAVDANNQIELERVKLINDKIVQFALTHRGTCTGEHGIGTGKRDYLKQEHFESYELMKSIKSLLDPNNIFSPGVLFER